MRILVISDIHSNLEAFEAVLADAGSVDQVWCLGDVVGYGPDPNACVDLLRSVPHQAIAGNHDWATLGKLDLNDFNPDARAANLWNRKQLRPDNLDYLRALPEQRVEGSFTLAHGSPRHPIWEYVIYESTAEAAFAYFETPICLVGHTHTPAIFRQAESSEGRSCEALVPSWYVTTQLRPGRWIVNPGSVGQPRDGDPGASYAIVDSEALAVEHRRVSYPVEKTQAKMMEHGLPMRLAVRLGYGW
ncbi:MAG: metallophosphoesterase family protein [Anaerolineae bacterium]|jgi:predicted phosphodiesterase